MQRVCRVEKGIRIQSWFILRKEGELGTTCRRAPLENILRRMKSSRRGGIWSLEGTMTVETRRKLS